MTDVPHDAAVRFLPLHTTRHQDLSTYSRGFEKITRTRLPRCDSLNAPSAL